MPDQNGQTTTTSPNYVGILRQMKKRPNAVLKLIGGLSPDNTVQVGNGWRTETNYQFSTGVDYDLPAPSQTGALEGAVAPQAVTNTSSQGTNVVQLVQEKVDISYLAMSTPGRITGVTTAGMTPAQAAKGAQITRRMEKVAQDINWSFLRGIYQNPVNPSATALKTRGIITSVVTNRLGNAGVARPITKGLLKDLYKAMIDNGGVQPESLYALVNTAQMAAVSALYEDKQITNSVNEAGIMIRTVYTPFGVLQLVLELDMDQTKIGFVNASVIQGVVVNVPEKPEGLFYEDLAQVGSSKAGQIYGQLGIDHGPEWSHGVLEDLSV